MMDKSENGHDCRELLEFPTNRTWPTTPVIVNEDIYFAYNESRDEEAKLVKLSSKDNYTKEEVVAQFPQGTTHLVGGKLSLAKNGKIYGIAKTANDYEELIWSYDVKSDDNNLSIEKQLSEKEGLDSMYPSLLEIN